MRTLFLLLVIVSVTAFSCNTISSTPATIYITNDGMYDIKIVQAEYSATVYTSDYKNPIRGYKLFEGNCEIWVKRGGVSFHYEDDFDVEDEESYVWDGKKMRQCLIYLFLNVNNLFTRALTKSAIATAAAIS